MSNINRIRHLLVLVQFWRILGFLSSVVGLTCYSLSPSFKRIFGEWNTLKIFLYTVMSLIVTYFILFANRWRLPKSLLFKSHVGFLVLMLTSVYSLFCDQFGAEKPDTLSLISNVAFALMSLSLSMQIQLGFEDDILNFCLGVLTVQLLKTSLLILSLFGVLFCYVLVVLRSYGHLTTTVTVDDHVPIKIDTSANDRRKQLYRILGIETESEGLETFIFPSDFETKLKGAIASGFVKECYDVFITWRKQFLNDKLLNMGFQKLSIEEVRKLPLKYLKDDIEQWAKASNDVVKRLFPRERHLCHVIFSGFSPLDDLSFMEVCRGLTTQLLNYADAVSTTTQSPERLFRIIDVLETMEDILPNLESLFSNQHCGFLYDEAITICKRLEEAIGGVFMELENLIRYDPAKVAVTGGGLHPTNRYVMNYLEAACQCRKTLERVFEENLVSSLSSSSSSSCSLPEQMVRIVELLESNLEANSKIYEDFPLCSVFMMNNGRYIVHKAKNSELGKVLGDEWMQKLVSKVRQCLVSYQRSSWDRVLELLDILDNESLTPSHAKEKHELFKLQFEEICEKQSTWVIFDDQLRNVITSSLKKILFLAYENFTLTVQHDEEKTGDFGVQDIDALINKLFLGEDEHINPDHIPLTWTVVLPSAKDFHEWRKYGEKRIPSSTHTRKYYRCIHRNDQGCGARKHVQQIQENPKMYKTCYSGFHTCTLLLKAPQQ